MRMARRGRSLFKSRAVVSWYCSQVMQRLRKFRQIHTPGRFLVSRKDSMLGACEDVDRQSIIESVSENRLHDVLDFPMSCPAAKW